ncbi:MAG TPA: Clp protease N-terminal domain-containing protein [Solirubrobacteraceae bacterium]|nr:Clp protease N-terminal domain-containing protein [Solirubrobacteraceae bacterium]
MGIAQAADTPYRTSNLLVALIGLPGSVTRRCLDATRSGLGLEMRAWLMSNVARAGLHQGESFVPFAWAEREDVRIAQRLALSEKCSFVSEAHLLLAVLDSPSRTVRAMRENLGGYFVRLRAEVARAPRAQPAALTPEDGVSSWPTSDQRLPSP